MARKQKAAEPLATIWHADDALWGEVEAVLKELDPPAHYGPGRIDQRKAFDGVIYRLRSGVQWNHLPKEFGDDVKPLELNLDEEPTEKKARGFLRRK